MIRKITLLSLLVVWISASPAPGQGGGGDWAAALFNNDLIHDFGTVTRGKAAEHHFKLENIYLEDVEIGSVTTSCGCTKLSKTKALVKTYETAEIVAEMDTLHFQGFKEATIHVSLTFRPRAPNRAPVQREVLLKLRAFIRGDIVFDPGLVDFAPMPPGQTAEKHVTVKYAGRGRPNWGIVEAESPVPYLAVSFQQTDRHYDAAENVTWVTYDLLVKLKETAPAGYFQGQVTLKTNDQDAQKARIPVVVQGYIVPTLSVSPAMLMLGEHKPGETVPANLVVRGVKGKPLRIVGVTGPDAQFRFTQASEPKEVQVIAVSFTAGNKPGKVTGKIHITTDLGGVDVDVAGQIVAGDPLTPPPGSGPAKPEGAKIDPAKPGASGLDAAMPGENVLRRGRLQPVEPDVTTPAGPK